MAGAPLPAAMGEEFRDGAQTFSALAKDLQLVDGLARLRAYATPMPTNGL